jgi:hypothetical protein
MMLFVAERVVNGTSYVYSSFSLTNHHHNDIIVYL